MLLFLLQNELNSLIKLLLKLPQSPLSELTTTTNALLISLVLNKSLFIELDKLDNISLSFFE